MIYKAPGYERSCATCQFSTKLTESLHYNCNGCIVLGQCTHWQEKPEQDGDGGKDA